MLVHRLFHVCGQILTLLGWSAIPDGRPGIGCLSEEEVEVVVVYGDWKLVTLAFDRHRRVVHHQPEREFGPNANVGPGCVPVEIVSDYVMLWDGRVGFWILMLSGRLWCCHAELASLDILALRLRSSPSLLRQRRSPLLAEDARNGAPRFRNLHSQERVTRRSILRGRFVWNMEGCPYVYFAADWICE